MPSEARGIEPPPARRLFFALCPGKGVRDSLQQIVHRLRDQVSARWLPQENFHITLAFLGSVPDPGLLRLQRIDLVWPEAFVLRLEDLRVLRRRRMIWIAPRAEPDSLLRLVEVLMAGLDTLGMVPNEPRPFRAHLTLARNLRGGLKGAIPFEPIDWTIRSVELMESVLDLSGAQYLRRCSWPLQAMPTGATVK